MRTFISSLTLAALLLGLVALPALAVGGCPGSSVPQADGSCALPGASGTALGGGFGGVVGILNTITNWLFTILLILAVIFIILAAYRYLVSGGGDDVGKAHQMLIYAIVALVVAFLAKGIVFVVAQLVGAGGGFFGL